MPRHPAVYLLASRHLGTLYLGVTANPRSSSRAYGGSTRSATGGRTSSGRVE